MVLEERRRHSNRLILNTLHSKILDALNGGHRQLMDKLKKFISYYRPYRNIFFMDMFCALILSGIDLLFPTLVKYLMDEVYSIRPQNMLQIVFLTGAGLLVLYIIRYFC